MSGFFLNWFVIFSLVAAESGPMELPGMRGASGDPQGSILGSIFF